MKKVNMLETVEDTNKSLVDDGAKDVIVYKTDLLIGGTEYDLPDRQGQRLIDMGKAEAV